MRTHIRSRSLRRSSGDTIKSQGGSSVSSSARLCLAPSLPVLGHVSREIIIQLLNEDRNTALNVSFSPSLLTALFKSILNFFFSLTSSFFSHLFLSEQPKTNCSTFILYSFCLVSYPPLSLSLITSLNSLQRRFTFSGISGRKMQKML